MRTALLVWAVTLGTCGAALWAVAHSPQLAWRDPVYIGAGVAGVLGFCLLLFQPLLTTGHWLGLSGARGRRAHLYAGRLLIVLMVAHIAGLWLTSPPDMIDALLLRSPTPFSIWGVLALWSILCMALLAELRSRLSPRVWRLGHAGLAVVTVTASVAHTLQIDGTMGTLSKYVLCILALVALAQTIHERRLINLIKR